MLQPFTLVLDCDDADVRSMTAQGIRVAVARPAGIRAPNVVWLTFPPSVSTRIVMSHECGVFKAAVPDRAGARIDVLRSVHPAIEGATYSFVRERFEKPVIDPRIPRRHYIVHNAGALRAAFGLVQAAEIDGMMIVSPVSAIVVPSHSRADFVAPDGIFVWAQRDISSGSAIGDVPVTATAIAFDPHGVVKRYRYDAAISSFLPSPFTSDTKHTHEPRSEDEA